MNLDDPEVPLLDKRRSAQRSGLLAFGEMRGAANGLNLPTRSQINLDSVPVCITRRGFRWRREKGMTQGPSFKREIHFVFVSVEPPVSTSAGHHLQVDTVTAPAPDAC